MDSRWCGLIMPSEPHENISSLDKAKADCMQNDECAMLYQLIESQKRYMLVSKYI